MCEFNPFALLQAGRFRKFLVLKISVQEKREERASWISIKSEEIIAGDFKA